VTPPFGVGLAFKHPAKGAAPFSPLDLPNLELWLDASDTGGVDMTNLTTWLDLSGNGIDLDAQDGANVFHATGGPNNQPYVGFSAGGLYRLSPLIAGADAARTMFVVSRRGADGCVCVFDGRYGFNGFAYTYGLATSNKREVYLGGVAGEYDTGSNATNNWEKVCCINTGTGGSSGAQRFRLNGAERTLSASNATEGASTLYFSVGGDHPSTLPLNGDVAEVIICSGVTSADDIDLTEAYLLDKYGV